MIRAVFKFDVFDEKTRRKAEKLASRISGVKSVWVDGQNLLTVTGYFDGADALKILRKISNVAILSVAPEGSGNKSDERKEKKAGKQKEKIDDPAADVSDTPIDSLYVDASVSAQDNFSSFGKGGFADFMTKIRNNTSFARRRKETKFELHDLQGKLSPKGGSKALGIKSEEVKSSRTGIHVGARSHKDTEIEDESDVNRVDDFLDPGPGLSDVSSEISLTEPISRNNSPSYRSNTHAHSDSPLLLEGLKNWGIKTHDPQLEFVARTKSEIEEQSVQGILSEAGGSRTLESQYQVETNIKDIHVVAIHRDSVSEIEPEEDLGATSSMDAQTQMHLASSIVPHMQEITDLEELNAQIAHYSKSIEIPHEKPRVVVNDQSPLLVKEDDITYLKSVYLRLNDTTRKCLFNCALVYLNQEIEAKTLVHSWISDGLVEDPQEVFSVLQTLINVKLLHITEDREFFMLPERYRYILLDQVIPLESKQYFLMRSSKKLTGPPDVEEWEKAKEIHLMDNELSELPVNLNCPELLALFLQRNYNLRVIPSAFFENMPCLQVLNLSRTRVKTLPDSLFKLVNLKRLFLNHCDLLMALPNRVGEVKSLELLDLEGTKIMNLPNEIEQLTNLTSLKVSFCEPINNGRSEVPWKTIMTLSRVKELHIDVSPDDKRWNTDADSFLGKVCGLKLRALKLYLPRVELLSHLKLHSTQKESVSLARFSFTVGQHVKRIIPRIPRDAELELEQYSKFLRYVNGIGVPEDVKKVLEHATAFFLDRHSNARMLSEFGFKNMINLVCCVMGECNELETIHDGTIGIAGFPSLEYLCIYYMKSLTSIWKGPLNGGLSCLKHLTIRTCLELKTIFTVDLLANVVNLEALIVDDCPAMTSIVSCEYPGITTDTFLPNLKKVSLHYLPELSNFSSGLSILTRVEWMSIYDCPALKSLPINKSVNTNLREIKGETSWWESLKWDSAEMNSWDDIFVSID